MANGCFIGCQALSLMCGLITWCVPSHDLGSQGLYANTHVLQKPKRKPLFSSAAPLCLLLKQSSEDSPARALFWPAPAAFPNRLESPLERWAWHTLFDAALYTCRYRLHCI